MGINVGHYAFYGLSDPKRKEAYDNEMEFLEFKKQTDKQNREVIEKRAAAAAAEKELKMNTDEDAAKKCVVTVVSSLTDDMYPDNSKRRRARRALLQKNKRKNKQMEEESKYRHVLVLGTSHQNKFVPEYEKRVKDKSTLSNYTMADGKFVLSKDVADAIRGYHYQKFLPNITITSEKYSFFKNQNNFNKLKKKLDENGVDAIFMDYFMMADNVYLDELSDKIKERISTLLSACECDIVMPFTKCLLEYIHSSVDISQYDVTVLTEDTVSKQNHPLFFVDEHK